MHTEMGGGGCEKNKSLDKVIGYRANEINVSESYHEFKACDDRCWCRLVLQRRDEPRPSTHLLWLL